MSEVVQEAITRLSEKLPNGFDGSAKFVITGEGSIMLDQDGAREGDEEADVTLTASPEVFRAIISGDQNAVTAFMTGKLSINGSMGLAMKMTSIFG